MAKITPTTNPRLRGFSLAESLAASVVLAIAVLGVSGVLIAGSENARAVDDSAVCSSLARELMEEIIALPFAPPATGDVGGWSANNRNRFTYDNVADFKGYNDASPFDMLSGRSVSPQSGRLYKREVLFEYRATPSGAAVNTAVVAPATPADFGMVTVRVLSSGGESIALTRLVCNAQIER